MMTRDVLISILALAGLATPAHATLTYCNSGCTNNNSGMTYTTFGATAVGLGDAMSSPITFISGGLDGSGVYTDAGTGTVFTGFNGTTAEALILSGTSLAQSGSSGNGGNSTNGRSIQITLPANTFAFAMFVSSTAAFAGPYVELVGSPSNFNHTNGNYTLSISSSSDSQFFGIISDTAISSIFLGDLEASQSPIRIQSFEEGGPASTPEVSTFLSIGSGLVLMRFLRRRQQRRPRTKPLDPVFS